MRLVFNVVIASMVLLANCKNAKRKKSLVVEVQSHNQAMKSANPITDLEQTISQGMKDPFTDPQFVMNKINSEFFGNNLKNSIEAGTPMVEGNLHNRELMAFSNLGLNNPQTINPSALARQHVNKDTSLPLGFRQRQKSMQFSNLNKLQSVLGSKKNIAGPKISTMRQPLNANRVSLQPKIPSNINIAHLSAEAIHSSVNNGASNSPVETVDPATTSFAAPQEAQPGVETSQNIGDTLSTMLEQKGVLRSSDILPANPGAVSGKEIEDNFSSIKAFLEADDTLRQKKVMDPVRNPLEDLMHKKHHVARVRGLKKLVRSR
eukprot:gene17690-19458_t